MNLKPTSVSLGYWLVMCGRAAEHRQRVQRALCEGLELHPESLAAYLGLVERYQPALVRQTPRRGSWQRRDLDELMAELDQRVNETQAYLDDVSSKLAASDYEQAVLEVEAASTLNLLARVEQERQATADLYWAALVEDAIESADPARRLAGLRWLLDNGQRLDAAEKQALWQDGWDVLVRLSVVALQGLCGTANVYPLAQAVAMRLATDPRCDLRAAVQEVAEAAAYLPHNK